MKCDRCNEDFQEADARELHGRTICEDCYMDTLSPAKACDPWAVYAAKSFSDAEGQESGLTKSQSEILRVLKETGGATPGAILEKLRMKPADFERDLATLRHMEKMRAELRDGKKVLCLW